MHQLHIILLILLSVPGRVLSNPQTAATSCQSATADLQTNSFSIVQQTREITRWTEYQRSVPGNVCTKQSNIKTTCVMDYVNVTDSSDWCLNLPDTLYIETTFIYKCTNDENRKHMFYTIKNRPACYASSCYDGYDQSVLEGLERTTFDGLVAEFHKPTNVSEWGDTVGFDNCVQMRLAITDPVVSEVVTAIFGVNAPTASPTLSPAPTTSSAPSSGPTSSFAPTVTAVPTDTPMELTCQEESVQIISTDIELPVQKLLSGNQSTVVGVAEGLSSIESILMIDTNTGMGFEKYCTAVDIDDSHNITALCEFDYDDVIAFIAETDDSIAALCHNDNGVYVEDSVSIICISDEDPSATTKLVIKNKPSCRSKLCNADGVREVATTEFDRWMKLTLEKGMEEALAEGLGDDNIEILNGPQTCVIDSDDEIEEELVVVAVGGSALANIGGEPIPPTDECQAFTDAVDGNLNIYNQRTSLQRAILSFVDTDLRQICGSTIPGLLECNWDWSEVLEQTIADSDAYADAMKAMCMPDGSGNSGAGQYVESSFGVNCVHPNGRKLVMTNTNVPGCVGRPCTPGQAEYLFGDDYDFLADNFIANGWTCATEVFSVYTPYYNPFYGTYSIEEIGDNPQFNAINVDQDPDDPGSSDSNSENNDNFPWEDENLSTLLGGGDNITATDNPTTAPTGSPTAAYVDPSTARSFSNSMTGILLLPLALSMLIV